MRITKAFFVLGLAISLFGCGRGRNEQQADNYKMEKAGNNADSTSANGASSSAAVENNQDSVHKFVRTAELKFKVNDVVKSTYDIETITGRQGGFVTYTNLASTIDNTNITATSADSSIETTHFTVTNSIVLRVPNTRLDSTLKEIAANIDYLDYRVIKAEDVALQIMANKLAQKRAIGNEQRLANAIDQKGRKLNDITNAEETLVNKQEQSDNAQISNLSIADQVKYSTVNISIYQRQSAKSILISNEKPIAAYEQSFVSKLMESFKSGWEIIEALLVFATRFWALLLLLLPGYFIYKKYSPKTSRQ